MTELPSACPLLSGGLTEGRSAMTTEKRGVCEYGATEAEVQVAVGDQLDGFGVWMSGQTMTRCPEHGLVVFWRDLERFQRRRRRDV